MLLTRHAHTGMAGRFCGQIDPPLSKQGRQQVAKLGEELASHPLTHIFSSDLLRSRESANSIAVKSGLPINLMPRLREISFGEWEGLNWDEVSQKDAAYAQRWMEHYPQLPAPGGEDFGGFRERVRRAMVEVAVQTEGGCAAVLTHGGVIRTFMLDLLQLPESALAGIHCEYASCVEVRLEKGRWLSR